MTGQIAILIDARLHNELVLRTRKSKDVTGIIEDVIQNFLDRTETDDIWSEEYLDELATLEGNNHLATFGDPRKGLQWQTVFLPNGTKLRITYKGRENHADVRHGSIQFAGKTYSPSEWARKVANNTNRNAWHDIWVQLPDSQQWKLSARIREEEGEARS
jgi:hypothetical protein